MTRIFTEGGEMADVLFWDSSLSTTCVTATPTPYESAYCYKILANLTDPTSPSTGSPYKSITAISECYLRERIYMERAYASRLNYLPLFASGTTGLAWVSVNSTNHVYAATSGGTVETATATVNSGQWYLFEIYFKLADAPNGRFVVYQDGIKIIDFTGDTKPGSAATFDRIHWASASGAPPSYYMGLDDMALNDTAGGVDDTYCGDGVIIKVTPDGAGAHNNWHGSDGDDVSNWLLVDEYPNDGDTSYVYCDGSISGTQEQYALSDYSGTGKTITRIYPEARIRKTASAAHTVKLGTLASGGTDAMSSAQNLTTSYARYVGNEQTINPVDSGAWEEADIDALQFVVEVG